YCPVRLVVRLAGEFPEPAVLGGQLARRGAQLVEVVLQPLGPLVRRLDLRLRLPEVLAEIVERRLVLLERVEARARLERLRRQALERLFALLHIAVRRGELRRFLLGVAAGA